MTDDALRCATAEEFAAWMEAHHSAAGEVWLALPKKGTGVASVTRSEALDVALCYGWIDGKAFSGGVPDGWWAQRFSPRRARSPWSKINCARVEELIATGRMRPAGLEQVEQAKADGRWAAAYAPPSTAEVPPELQAALDASPAAATAFAALSKSSRYQILLTLQKAKKAETRARRIAGYVERLEAGEPPHGPARSRTTSPG
ncbi:YdeI/OmpD-associated family protein [Nonomuraea sp. K274]|uniref:YdeI/OmpD-associated family protein n=1 Tax=Nonomuraea cypriaca TaxID=1187855 RepID=A0A931AF21_9ACTN|nr:YdeI/OmpD-associated family protein [Nonomuraea cypriaca]MBF8191531.1 YdeI/OmpD-associated family protein [Nonomuraea cypriaca]